MTGFFLFFFIRIYVFLSGKKHYSKIEFLFPPNSEFFLGFLGLRNQKMYKTFSNNFLSGTYPVTSLIYTYIYIYILTLIIERDYETVFPVVNHYKL